jgi:hypothetical protein
MASKTVYTERDIEDLASRGVDSLRIRADMYLTDLAREKAERLNITLIREDETPASAPMRPYIAAAPARPAGRPDESGAQDLYHQVRQRVIERLGDEIDHDLLETIIRRVLANLGES